MRRLGFFLLFLALAPAAWAVMPDERLDDPVLEARARALSADIRCLVCQNESIDSSNADLARELRILVRERLSQGDSDQEVLDFLVDKYGDFVLFDPPFKASTYALWIGPVILMLFGVGAAIFYIRRQARAFPATDGGTAFTQEEDLRVQEILNDLGPANLESSVTEGDRSGKPGPRP
ncbi:MAG: cytochrome c-type biogenesis protein [Pseudomonadota bacterium]